MNLEKGEGIAPSSPAADGSKQDSAPDDVYEPPWWLLWLGLSVAVCMCSSAAVVFMLISEVPPLLRASWRLSFQFLAQLGPFLVEFYQHFIGKKGGEEAARQEHAKGADVGTEVGQGAEVTEVTAGAEVTLGRYLRNLPYLVLSGIFLGFHFGSWVWSLDHTTIAHSLLWVSMYPIILNLGHWTLWLLFVYLR